MRLLLAFGLLLFLVLVFNTKVVKIKYYIYKSAIDTDFARKAHRILQLSNWNKYHRFERTYSVNEASIYIHLKSDSWLEPYHKPAKYYPSGKQIRWSITHRLAGEPSVVYINAKSWMNGVAESKLRLNRYQTYVINHEFGHALGYDHKKCIGRDTCPVMYQSTKGCPIGKSCGYQPDERDIA